MKYLFKCRDSSSDVFFYLYQEMIKRGYECIRIIDDENKNYLPIIKSIKNEDIKLVTSDHVHISPKNGMSILEIMDYLKPVKTYYSIHDLAVNDIGYDIKYINNDFTLLLPGSPWNEMYDDINSNIITVGYPKFIKECDKKSGIIFSASLIYVYAERKPISFKKDFKYIIDNNIPIKFPACKHTNILIDKLKLKNIVDTSKMTFDLINEREVVISNSSSSVCVESAMCGSISINLGAGISKMYNKFNIHHMKVSDLDTMKVNQLYKLSGNKVYGEYVFKMEETINILKQ